MSRITTGRKPHFLRFLKKLVYFFLFTLWVLHHVHILLVQKLIIFKSEQKLKDQ